MIFENPFAFYTAEEITPKIFKEIFVKEYTWINALETQRDFFIYGVRGSGKSMLLNYLEFSHQLWYFNNNINELFKRDGKQKYLGIMVHAADQDLNTLRYELLLENELCKKSFIMELCMSDFLMAIIYKILITLIETKEMADYINELDENEVKDFCRKEFKSWDKRHIHSLNFDKPLKNTEHLRELTDVFSNERAAIQYYANDKYQIKDVEFEGNYASPEYIHSFILRIKRLLSIDDFSFYILMDNADEIKGTMQKCVDIMIGKRQHKDICFKIAIRKGFYWDMADIQSPHDYSEIFIDELYSYSHSVYHNRIIEIAKRRLEMIGMNVTLEELFPENPSEIVLLQKIKNELIKKYEKEFEKNFNDENDDMQSKKSEYINNRVSKYAQAELFRRLKKTPKSYAGFSNIIHLSSGIIRQFLEICRLMFDEEFNRTGTEVTKISLKSQNAVIKKSADDFMDKLEKKYKGLEKQETFTEAKQNKDLYTLIEALGKHYRQRLMDVNFKEPRVFTFTLKDSNKNMEIEKILEIGVNDNYFQSYWYSSKMGLGKYKGYAFNRRLCPRYNIDHTSFRGRIELTSEQIKNAIDTGIIDKSALIDEDNRTLDSFS
ncbi:MAG: hypothetical protein OIN86_16675 [Candidatus Methanoperedens sp.]|nr:hypothetical protein [Candidatus Methanoperedens sp.]CAG1003539.1 hypothetical protein METP1_03082 [Methanosarcinales archaeon]